MFIWLATGQIERIGGHALASLRNSENHCYLSVVSVVEVELKMAIGKLDLPHNWETARSNNSCRWLGFSSKHGLALRKLPLIHRDPFDRMLAAQALASDFTLVTADNKLLTYPIKTMRT